MYRNGLDEIEERIASLHRSYHCVADHLGAMHARLEALTMRRQASSGGNTGCFVKRRRRDLEAHIQKSEGKSSDVSFVVRVVGISGRSLDVDVGIAGTISSVKASIEEAWDVQVQEQKLVIGDRLIQDSVKVCSLGSSGDIIFTMVRVQNIDFKDGDKVIAVKDSAYISWRKAGDEGVVQNFQAGGDLEVYWFMHCETTPFSPDLYGADPYDLLRIVYDQACTVCVGNQVVAATDSADSLWKAGCEGVVQSLGPNGTINVLWQTGQTSDLSSAQYGNDATALVRVVHKAVKDLAPRKLRHVYVDCDESGYTSDSSGPLLSTNVASI